MGYAWGRSTTTVTGDGMHPSIAAFLEERRPSTPCLVLALDVVAQRYEALRAALPNATVHYAVKANPELPVVRLLADLGASFDVASPGEVDICLGAGTRAQ